MNLAVIGLGSRCRSYVNRILNREEFQKHTIVAVCDIDPVRLKHFSEHFFAEAPVFPRCYSDWRDLMEDPSVEGVFITTPDHAHMEIALAAMEKGMHILLEKPVEAEISRAEAIYQRGRDYPKTLMLGFVLRYAPFYLKIKEIVDRGDLGQIVSISASENLDKNHSSSFFRRWHRFRKNSGGMMNTKCCHDLDLLNYILQDRVKSLSSFGSNFVYVPRADGAEHCCDCGRKEHCLYSFNYTNYQSPTRWDCQEDLCVYNCEKEVFDRQIVAMEYESGVLAELELVMFSGEETRRIRIIGTRATLDGDLRRKSISIKPLDPACEGTEILLPPPESGHGGGDDGLLFRFFESAEGETCINDIEAGYLATLTAISADISALEKRMVFFGEAEME